MGLCAHRPIQLQRARAFLILTMLESHYEKKEYASISTYTSVLHVVYVFTFSRVHLSWIYLGQTSVFVMETIGSVFGHRQDHLLDTRRYSYKL